MKRILFSVVFLLSLTLAQAASAAKSAPEKADREKVSVALQKVVQDEWNHAQKKLEETFPSIAERALLEKLTAKGELSPEGKERYAHLHKEQSALDDVKDYLERRLSIRTPVGFLLRNRENMETPFVERDATKRQKRDFYTEMIRGEKRIFMWEADHQREGFISEYNEILKVARKANPHARILLALEPLENTTVETIPIQFYDKKREQNLFIFKAYKNMLKTAKKLKIDVLALDDFITYEQLVSVDGKATLFQALKVGDELCPFIPEAVWDDFESYLTQDLYDFENLLKGSHWGAHIQRNKQWAERINAVEKYYDVVIILAGNGHYGLKTFLTPFENDEEVGDFYFHSPLTKAEKEKEARETKIYIKELDKLIKQWEKESSPSNPYDLEDEEPKHFNPYDLN